MTTPNSTKTIGGAINKKLLTPCRRIGLSRNQKTANSKFKSPLADTCHDIVNIVTPINAEIGNSRHDKKENLKKTPVPLTNIKQPKNSVKVDKSLQETSIIPEENNKIKDVSIESKNKQKKKNCNPNIVNKSSLDESNPSKVKVNLRNEVTPVKCNKAKEIKVVLEKNNYKSKIYKKESLSKDDIPDEQVNLQDVTIVHNKNEDLCTVVEENVLSEHQVRKDNLLERHINLKEDVTIEHEEISAAPEENTHKRKKYKEKSNVGESPSRAPHKFLKKRKVYVISSDSEESVVSSASNKDFIDEIDFNPIVLNKSEISPKQYSRKKKMCVIRSDSEDSIKSSISNDEKKNFNSDNREFRIIKKIHRTDSNNLQDIQDVFLDVKKDDITNVLIQSEENLVASDPHPPLIKIEETLDTLTNDSIEVSSTMNENGAKNNTKRPVKRKLSLKMKISKSSEALSDEDDLISISNSPKTNTQNSMDTKTLIDEILKLEKTVHDKEMKLEKFQQTQIYKSLHNLDDLKNESDMWKSGCQEALRDLLKKLQEHAAIDMDGLLKNLKAPPHLIKYDSDNDSFL